MVDNRVLAVIYLYVLAAMLSSSLVVTNFGFEFGERIPQVGVAAVLGVFWTVYYVWAIHPKVLEYAAVTED